MKALRWSKGIAPATHIPRHCKGMGGQGHAPVAWTPGRKPSTHCIGGYVGPRDGLGGYGKPHPHWGSKPGLTSPYRVATPITLCRQPWWKSCCTFTPPQTFDFAHILKFPAPLQNYLALLHFQRSGAILFYGLWTPLGSAGITQLVLYIKWTSCTVRFCFPLHKVHYVLAPQ
jgi:hypothetical protein